MKITLRHVSNDMMEIKGLSKNDVTREARTLLRDAVIKRNPINIQRIQKRMSFVSSVFISCKWMMYKNDTLIFGIPLLTLYS